MSVLVCLTSSDHFYSKAIRFLTKSNVNHAFIAYTSKEWGGYWCVQVDARGVVKVPVENLEYDEIECYEFLDLNMESAMIPFRKFVGERYDWFGIVGFLLKLIAWRVFGRRIMNFLHRKNEQFCSEAVVRFLQRVDGMYDWIMVLDPSSVAPGGNKQYIGVPSLQEILIDHVDSGEVRYVDCPFSRRSDDGNRKTAKNKKDKDSSSDRLSGGVLLRV